MRTEPHTTFLGGLTKGPAFPEQNSRMLGSSLWAAFTAWAHERRRRRRIVRELSSHTDRELSELGFSRADFSAIANGTYRR